MVYVECWTPEDFSVAEDGDESSEPVDWNDPKHIEASDCLSHYFDANYGTNWERVRDAAN